MGAGNQLGMRLFIEGLEVPVISATVGMEANSPATASIQIIATDRALDLLPRTLVHLFFLDWADQQAYEDTDLAETSEKVGLSTANTTGLYKDEQYKLFFVGELQGIQFQKSSGSRQIILTCVDLSNYWDTTYQYNFNGSLFSGRRHAAFIGANANFFNSPLGKGTGTIARLLGSNSVNFPFLRGLLAGIVRVLETIGGSYYGRNTFRGANHFSSIAELRLKILQQITAADKDTSTEKLFRRKTFNQWMNRQAQSLGKLVTFRGLVNVMQGFVFHEIYPNPCARYVPGGEIRRVNTTRKVNIRKDPATRADFAKIIRLEKSIQSARNLLGGGDATIEDTLRTNPNNLQLQQKLSHDMYHAQRLLADLAGRPDDVGGIRSFGLENGEALNKVKSKIGNVAGGGFSINPLLIADPSNIVSANNTLSRIISAIIVIKGNGVRHKGHFNQTSRSRLNNQILRPDLWWAAAPNCNVLFPDAYETVGWQRNFFREVSRLELQTTNEVLGSDALFNGRYYSPDATGMRNGLRLSSKQFGRLILPHELLTGIIPMFEKISEANLFAMKARKVKYKGARVGYAQRAANFQYFKHRFASRQMQAGGRFNPWFVPGFPSVLIDRPMSVENLAISTLPVSEQADVFGVTKKEPTKADLLKNLVPHQYVGSNVSLSHSLTQQGGRTDYVFGQARVHRESTEFLGIDRQYVSRAVGSPSTRKDVYGGFTAPKVNGEGPLGGRIIKVKNVTDAYYGRSVEGLDGSRVIIAESVFIATDTANVKDGSTNLVSQPRVANAYEITEQYTRRRREEVDIPIEEAVRPPWIWDGYTNLKIGETYHSFFGTNSIVDFNKITTKDEFKLNVSAEELTILAENKKAYVQGSGLESKREPRSGGPGDPFNKRLPPNPLTKQRVPNRPDTTTTGAQKSSIRNEADKSVNATTNQIIKEDKSIEASIDFLVRVYSMIRQNQLDVQGFERNYTWRPIATMNEILGTRDLQFNEDGTEVTQGTEGFHSRAFGDFENLFGLVDPNVEQILGLSKEKDAAAIRRLDIRKRRREAVRDYLVELREDRGLLG